MFGYQFASWVPILFFVALLVGSFLIGKWLVNKDRNY